MGTEAPADQTQLKITNCGTGPKGSMFQKDEIKAAVKRVGTRVEDVARELSEYS
jgi:hypothetical protein